MHGPELHGGTTLAILLGNARSLVNSGDGNVKLFAVALAGLGFLSMSPFATAADGKATYEATCAACHATGVADAPKLGDKTAWAPRMAAGKAGLVASVKNGKGVMPPNASGAKLSDPDISAAVDFMLATVK